MKDKNLPDDNNSESLEDLTNDANNIIEAYKMKKLWKGLEFCLLRAFIVNGVGFMMFNYLK